jgi:hypothetical protein
MHHTCVWGAEFARIFPRGRCGSRMPGSGRITRRLGRDRCRQQPLAFLPNHGVAFTDALFQTVAVKHNDPATVAILLSFNWSGKCRARQWRERGMAT